MLACLRRITAAFARRCPYGTRATDPRSAGGNAAAILPSSSTVESAVVAATIGYSTAYCSGVATTNNWDSFGISLPA